jgi:cytochrome oxidase assembly protein ShyY1
VTEGRRRIGARWIVGTVLVAAIVFGCIEAGFWQLRRLDERRALNARIRERSADTGPLPPVDATTDPDDLTYRGVDLAGTYDATHEVLVRFRSRIGLPGYEVLTPLRTDGVTVLVDRGWVPLEDGDRWPGAAMAPPAGEVEVTGVLLPSEEGSTRLERRDDGVPVVAAIDPTKLRSAVGEGDLYPLYVLADRGGAGAESSFPAPVDPPSLGEGPHRDYAVQWFLFASVGIVGWVLLLRRRGPLAKAQPSSASMASSTDADLVT